MLYCRLPVVPTVPGHSGQVTLNFIDVMILPGALAIVDALRRHGTEEVLKR